MEAHSSKSVGTGDAMRVLLIEDDPVFLEDIVPKLRRTTGSTGILTVAESRDSAIKALNDAALKNEFYDIFILDLKIPTIDRGGDAEIEHGKTVFYHVLNFAPHTPVYILTGEDAKSLFNDLLTEAAPIDVWGARQLIPTIQMKWKEDVTQFFDELDSVARCIADTDDIEISTPRQPSLPLTAQQNRVLRVFARRRGGHSCEVAPLEGGLSSSRVFRVAAKGIRGHRRIVAAGKIADIAVVKDEVDRFNRHVLGLEVGAYAPIVDIVEAGAGLTGGVFYRLLDPNSRSLFSSLATNPTRVPAVVAKVRDITKPWIAGEEPAQVVDIRRRLVGDKDANELVRKHNLSRVKKFFVSKRIQVRQACLHGDLHGGNILVDRHWKPRLIDFSEVDDGVASLDPITLELSLLFHPDFQQTRGAWPSIDTAALWSDPSKYTQGCQFPEFIHACRNWSEAVAAGKREIYASAYTYLLLQLKYPNTDKKLIVALLQAVWCAFRATYK
jgi:DNA-binding NarL/FixJ family response regulator